MPFENSKRFAKQLDKADHLRDFRKEFYIPKHKGKDAIYFTGNSLGLQPRAAKKMVMEELDDWARLGVEGHVHSRRPWVRYQHFSKKWLGEIVGAKPTEVVAMNQLTVNLHLMMVSFFRPTKERYKIITESGAFSSDQYAFESQLRFHRLNPDDALIELKPREGEITLRTEDILAAIAEHGKQTALVIFGGVQYYTGQFFDIRRITAAAHREGAYAGFDLAHAVGNVVLNLHRDDVDFAVWCTYKYLNSGPGAIAGAFVHDRFKNAFDIPRFSGWWGHNEEERFQMKKGFKPISGVDGWQLSNHPILPSAVHLASLEIFHRAGMRHLRKKSEQLTGYLHFLLTEIESAHTKFKIITPSSPKERGCQLSLFIHQNGRKVFEKLTRNGVIADWREPNVIRVAPAPLYNSFEEVYRFVDIFKSAL